MHPSVCVCVWRRNVAAHEPWGWRAPLVTALLPGSQLSRRDEAQLLYVNGVFCPPKSHRVPKLPCSCVKVDVLTFLKDWIQGTFVSPEQNYSESRYHFLHSSDGEGCAKMLVEYSSSQGFRSEVDMFVAQAVLQWVQRQYLFLLSSRRWNRLRCWIRIQLGDCNLSFLLVCLGADVSSPACLVFIVCQRLLWTASFSFPSSSVSHFRSPSSPFCLYPPSLFYIFLSLFLFFSSTLQVPLLKEQKWRVCSVQRVHRETPVHREGPSLPPASTKLYLVSAAGSGWVSVMYCVNAQEPYRCSIIIIIIMMTSMSSVVKLPTPQRAHWLPTAALITFNWQIVYTM